MFRFQESDHQANLRNQASWSPLPSEDVSDNWPVPRNRINCALGAVVPKVLLQGPWTDGKVDLCERLLEWGVRTVLIHTPSCKGLEDAIEEGNVRAIESMETAGVLFTHSSLRKAVFSGCNKVILRMIFRDCVNMVATRIDFRDRDIRRWAQERIDEGDPKGHWLMDIMTSSGEKYSHWNDEVSMNKLSGNFNLDEEQSSDSEDGGEEYVFHYARKIHV